MGIPTRNNSQNGGGLPRASHGLPKRPAPQDASQSASQPFDDSMEQAQYDANNAYVEPNNTVTDDYDEQYLDQPEANFSQNQVQQPMMAQMAQNQPMMAQNADYTAQMPQQNHYYTTPQSPAQMSDYTAYTAQNTNPTNDYTTPSQSYSQPTARRKPEPEEPVQVDRHKGSKIKPASKSLSRSQARAYRWVVLLTLVAMAGFGAKNAIIPPDTLSADDVHNIAVITMGKSGFPMEAGAAIAKTFATAYVTLNNDNAGRAILTKYYKGLPFDATKSHTVGDLNSLISSDSDFSQKLRTEPYIVREQSTSKNLANYTVGMLVYKTIDGYSITDPQDESNIGYKWLFLNIGVYYNDKKQTFAIDKTSPTLVSEPETFASNTLPDAAKPGNKHLDEAVTKDARDTVVNFMKAWGKSDVSALSTLTSKNCTVGAKRGLGGNYTLDDEATGSQFQFEAYGKTGDSPYYYGLVTVKWRDAVDGKIPVPDKDGTGHKKITGNVMYTSKYVLLLEKTGSGKYLVQSIMPYYYQPAKNQ